MSFNDPQWGRSAGSDKPRNDEQENQQRQDQNQPDPNDENKRREEADRQASDNDRNNMSDRRGNRNEGNDLDQLWNDFNRMVNSILGGQKDPRGNRQSQDAWQSRRETKRLGRKNSLLGVRMTIKRRRLRERPEPAAVSDVIRNRFLYEVLPD